MQALIEGTYGRKMKLWGSIVDSLINNLVFETSNIHLRQVEGREGGRDAGRERERLTRRDRGLLQTEHGIFICFYHFSQARGRGGTRRKREREKERQ